MRYETGNIRLIHDLFQMLRLFLFKQINNVIIKITKIQLKKLIVYYILHVFFKQAIKQNQCIYNTNMYIQLYRKEKKTQVHGFQHGYKLVRKNKSKLVPFLMNLFTRVSAVTKKSTSNIKILDGIWQDCVILYR